MVAAAEASTTPNGAGDADGGAASDSTPALQNDSASAANASAASDPTLKIPITSAGKTGEPDHFIEIFPEELPDVPPSVLARVLRDEDAPLRTWTDAALMYVQRKRELECSDLLTEACELEKVRGFQNSQRVRTLASAGIASLTQVNSTKGGEGGGGGVLVDPPTPENVSDANVAVNPAQAERNEELKGLAEDRFMRAGKVDQLFPMTWVGRGMMNLSIGRVDQARFFFETTLRQCGQVLPALLGMAAVRYRENDNAGAQEMYGRAMTLFPEKSGGSARVGFGLACYRLGQIDRAKAAFKRALDMDRDNVEAMIGLAILDMASLDETSRDFRQRSERCIRLISSANLVDRSNAMVQNHLANHYFWKWAPLPGTVEVTAGGAVVKGSQSITVETGDRVRIGQGFETVVVDEEGENEIRVKDAWKGTNQSGLKLWKKDYDRVLSLARSAYSSTTVKEVQAESLYLLARVYHVRDEMDAAHKFYDKACKLAPDLGPARFGLAQCLIYDDEYEEAAAHLRLVLGSSPHSTDALAALGLVEVKTGKDRKEAFGYLKKAIDQDPLNAELVQLEALALQQREAEYERGLERYGSSVRLVEGQGRTVPFEVWTNMGVLCHETKKFDDALGHYESALKAVDRDVEGTRKAALDDAGTDSIRHKDNNLFWEWVGTGVQVARVSEGEDTLLAVVGDDGKSGAVLPDGVKVGDHVRLGDDFVSEVVEINSEDGKDRSRLVLKRSFVPPVEATKEEETKDGGDEEAKENEKEKEPAFNAMPFALAVKRSNHRLENANAVSVAFNLARLHEAAGRVVPAVELHKAIVTRHPSYVNSYLRLACIARDCGSLPDCSEWLKSAASVAPGNPEVLTLVGNLHLSLCDWAPAQTVFNQLLEQKVPKVEAYSMLSLGNIYFNNLKTPRKYTKHLQYSADFYKRILNKDKANAYAANGLGTVLAERGELLKAKEAFNRVREVSGDSMPDALLNLGHVYLAQKRHPEALQMYQSYMNRTRGSSAANITSKSRDEDDSTVLLYVAFAYFDWAKITEQFNSIKAAPADGLYQKCVEFIEKAMEKSKKENVTLRYDWCMAKLMAANCVLQKPQRSIRRNAKEVRDALDGLEKSLPIVQTLLQWKNEGKRIPVATSTLNDFVGHCKTNIEVAKTHLKEEMKREQENNEMREMQRFEANQAKKEKDIKAQMKRDKMAAAEEARDKRARDKMFKVSNLVAGWEHEAESAKKKDDDKKKRTKNKGPDAPMVDDDESGIFDDEVPDEGGNNAANALFDDSDDDNDNDDGKGKAGSERDKAGGSDSDAEGGEGEEKQPPPVETEKDLFGDDSDDDSDEELVPSKADASSSKRAADESSGGDDGKNTKKRRVLDDDED